MSDIPERVRAICEFCRAELNVGLDGVHQFKSGWVKNRSGGGGHGLSLVVPHARWAHGHCIDQEVAGHTHQGSMF